MLDFIGQAFKGIFTVIVVIALIVVVIGGFIFMSNSPLLGFLTWVGGFLFIILSAGLVSIFLNIDTNLQKLVDQGNKISQIEGDGYSTKSNTNQNAKKCPFCAENIKQEAKICPHCNKNIEEYENEKKTKELEAVKIKDQEMKEKFKNIEDLFNDENIMNEAKKLRRLYGKGVYISHLKSKAKELGLGDIDLNENDIE
jgi:hypothetical protein